MNIFMGRGGGEAINISIKIKLSRLQRKIFKNCENS